MVGHRYVGRHQRIVDELRHLAGAHVADAHDESTKGLEDRPRSRRDFLGAADHDGQRAGGSRGSAAAHGRIQERYLASGSLRAQLDHRIRMHGGMNGDATAGAHGGNQLAADLPRACVVEDADTDVVGARAQFGNART
jgi:hypothetical protein